MLTTEEKLTTKEKFERSILAFKFHDHQTAEALVECVGELEKRIVGLEKKVKDVTDE